LRLTFVDDLVALLVDNAKIASFFFLFLVIGVSLQTILNSS